MSDYDSKILTNVAAEEKQAEQVQDDKVILSSGVVLKLKKVSPLRIQAVVKRFKHPPVPSVYDKELGREIKNPDHPEYKRQCQEIDAEQLEAGVDALIAFGTTLFSKPDDIPTVEDDSWVEEMDLFNIVPEAIHTSKLARYLAWVKYVAMIDLAKDFVAIGNQFNLGVSEEKVAEAIDGFRSDEKRATP